MADGEPYQRDGRDAARRKRNSSTYPESPPRGPVVEADRSIVKLLDEGGGEEDQCCNSEETDSECYEKQCRQCCQQFDTDSGISD